MSTLPHLDLNTSDGIERFTLHFKRYIEETFSAQQSLEPLVCLFLTKDPITRLVVGQTPQIVFIDVGAAFSSPRTKQTFATGLRRLAAQGEASGLVMASEAWMMEAKPGGPPLDLSIPTSQHPNRYEAILLSIEHRTGTRTWIARIHRDPNGPARLETWHALPSAQTMGILTNLLGPPSAKN